MDKSYYITKGMALVLMGLVFLAMHSFASALNVPKDGPEGAKGNDSKLGRSPFGRIGYGALCIGGLLLVALQFIPDFDQFPDERHMVSFMNLYQYKVSLPWGKINVFAALLGSAVGTFLLFAAREHWKERKAYIRATLCILIALGVLWVALIQRV